VGSSSLSVHSRVGARRSSRARSAAWSELGASHQGSRREFAREDFGEMISMRASNQVFVDAAKPRGRKQSRGVGRFRASLSRRTQDECSPNLLPFNLGQQVDDEPNTGSKYPPAKPGALRVEPLKAAIGVAGAPPICGPPEGGSWVPRLVCCVLQLRIRFVSYTGEVPRSIVRIRLCGLGFPMRSRSSVDGALLVHLATRARRFIDGRLWRDCRKCQTFAASPAEPGDLLC
jgi:hypothetical protein